MKKRFLILSLLLISVLAFSQNKKNAPTKKPNTQKNKVVPATNVVNYTDYNPPTTTNLLTFERVLPPKVYDYTTSDLGVKWHQLIFDLIEQTNGYTPNVAARSMAYINLAFYETIVPSYKNYQSLSGQLQGFSRPDSLMPDSASIYAPAAANEAIFLMVDKLFAPAPYVWMERVYATKDSIDMIFAQNTSAEIMNDSQEYGRKIAAWIYEYAKTDGGDMAFLRSYDMNYKVPVCESCFEINRVADLENTGPLHPNWGKNRTFLADNTQDFGIKPLKEFSKYQGSPFHQQAMEVYRTAMEVKPGSEKLLIANFWDDAATFTYTATGHSLSILSQHLRANTTDLAKSASLFCQLSLGVSDAMIVCWGLKYKYNTIRPIAYIKRYIDSQFEPALLTPPFPEFPSGHSVQSATMATVLTSKIGDNVAVTDYSKFFVGPPRKFNSFWESANETSISRLYGGIHFKDALDQGQVLGKKIGENVLKLKFLKD